MDLSDGRDSVRGISPVHLVAHGLQRSPLELNYPETPPTFGTWDHGVFSTGRRPSPHGIAYITGAPPGTGARSFFPNGRMRPKACSPAATTKTGQRPVAIPRA